jgi:hypothetical protein
MRAFIAVVIFLGTCGVSLAQEGFEDGKFSVQNKEQYLKEFLEMQLNLDKPTAGLFSKHRYCVRCNNGKNLNCDVPSGGEIGKKMCESYGMAACGSGHVDFNGC